MRGHALEEFGEIELQSAYLMSHDKALAVCCSTPGRDTRDRGSARHLVRVARQGSEVGHNPSLANFTPDHNHKKN